MNIGKDKVFRTHRPISLNTDRERQEKGNPRTERGLTLKDSMILTYYIRGTPTRHPQDTRRTRRNNPRTQGLSGRKKPPRVNSAVFDSPRFWAIAPGFSPGNSQMSRKTLAPRKPNQKFPTEKDFRNPSRTLRTPLKVSGVFPRSRREKDPERADPFPFVQRTNLKN